MGEWSVIIPVKRLGVAKSRLAVVDRSGVALAMAMDTAAAALAAEHVALVLVVTEDHRAGEDLRRLGCVVEDDEPRAGLNPALVHGALVASRLTGPGPVAALSADLPALRRDELDQALSAAAGYPLAVVGDSHATGTTFYAARDPADFRPMFGPDSLGRHVAAGAVELQEPRLARLRLDVDTVADLATAVDAGVGRHTAALLRATRPVA